MPTAAPALPWCCTDRRHVVAPVRLGSHAQSAGASPAWGRHVSLCKDTCRPMRGTHSRTPFPHSAQDYLAGRRTPEVAGLARPTGRVTRPVAVTANAARPANCAQQHAARSIHMFGSPSVRWEGPRPCEALRAGRHHCPRRYPLSSGGRLYRSCSGVEVLHTPRARVPPQRTRGRTACSARLEARSLAPSS